jgi:putative transposase
MQRCLLYGSLLLQTIRRKNPNVNTTSSPPNKHARDLRKGRYSEPGYTYLLTAIIHNRRPVFAEWQIGRLLVAEMRAAEACGLVQTLAWVVMPDHLHWLVTLQSGELPALMQGIKGRSAITINRALGIRGQLWQKGFHDHALRQDEDLQAAARYIVANPLRAGLVKQIGDYPLWDAIWQR